MQKHMDSKSKVEDALFGKSKEEEIKEMGQSFYRKEGLDYLAF